MTQSIVNDQILLENGFGDISSIPVVYEVLNDNDFFFKVNEEDCSENWTISNVQTIYSEPGSGSCEGDDGTLLEHVNISDNDDITILEHINISDDDDDDITILEQKNNSEVKEVMKNEPLFIGKDAFCSTVTCDKILAEEKLSIATKTYAFKGKLFIQGAGLETSYVNNVTRGIKCENQVIEHIKQEDENFEIEYEALDFERGTPGDVDQETIITKEDCLPDHDTWLQESVLLKALLNNQKALEPSGNSRDSSYKTTYMNGLSKNVELSGNITNIWALNELNCGPDQLTELGINIFERKLRFKEVALSNVEILQNVKKGGLDELPILSNTNNNNGYRNKSFNPNDLSNPDKQSDNSVQQENNSVQQENNSVQQENNSVQQENNSVQQQNNSVQQENNSVQQENNSVQQENNSVQQKNNSGQQENNSVQKESNSVQHENNSTEQSKNSYRPKVSCIAAEQCYSVKQISNPANVKSANKSCHPNKLSRPIITNKRKRSSDSVKQSCNAPKRRGAQESVGNESLNLKIPPIKDKKKDLHSLHILGSTHVGSNYKEIETKMNLRQNLSLNFNDNKAFANFRNYLPSLCKPKNDFIQNTFVALPIVSVDLEMDKCIENWRLKYPWILYENRIFSCSDCKSSTPIFKIENIDQKFRVSAKLCAHESSISHKVFYLRRNENLLFHIIKFMKCNLLQYSSKDNLLKALAIYINSNLKMTLTEQNLAILVEATSTLLEEIEFANTQLVSNDGISLIVDQCRRLLVLRKKNTLTGQMEEFLVPKFLDERSSFMDIYEKISENVVYCKYLMCGNCKSCLKNPLSCVTTLPVVVNLDTLPVRYPSMIELVNVLQIDPAVQRYRSLLCSLSLNQKHWTDINNIIWLKSLNNLNTTGMSYEYTYMEIVLKMVNAFIIIFSNRCVVHSHLLHIINLVSQLKTFLSNLTLNYIQLLLRELKLEFYYNGMKNMNTFVFLSKPELLANISSNPDALPVVSRIFNFFKVKLPVESPISMVNHLSEFGKFVCNERPLLKFTFPSLLRNFQEDELLRKRFSVVLRFYEMFALLPCFRTTRDISLLNASSTFNNLVKHFKQPLAAQIMQIRNTEISFNRLEKDNILRKKVC